jgi:hypothetical protein
MHIQALGFHYVSHTIGCSLFLMLLSLTVVRFAPSAAWCSVNSLHRAPFGAELCTQIIRPALNLIRSCLCSGTVLPMSADAAQQTFRNVANVLRGTTERDLLRAGAAMLIRLWPATGTPENRCDNHYHRV